jgi:hypothetical protein
MFVPIYFIPALFFLTSFKGRVHEQTCKAKSAQKLLLYEERNCMEFLERSFYFKREKCWALSCPASLLMKTRL